MRNRFSTIVALSSAAVAAAFAVPAAASAEPIALLSGNGDSIQLLDTARPQQVTLLPITGVGAGEVLSAIDVRPASGVLYAISIEDDGATRTGRVYTIDLATGAATLVGTDFGTALSDTDNWSIDFNPAVDRLRVVSDAGDNLRVNQLTGGLVATDTPLDTDPAPGTQSLVTDVADVAYDRSVAGATVTTLYAIRSTDPDQLAAIGSINSAPNSPNGGVVTDIGATGLDTNNSGGFDISSATNTGFVYGGGGATPLRTINLTTGATTPIVGSFLGNPRDLAVLAPSTIGLAGATAVAQERDGKLDVLITRTGATTVAGSVDYATVDGTAKAGSDYTTVAGTVKFAIGETTKTISIPLVDDGTGDAGEIFTLALSNAAGANLGTAVQTITTVETQVADKTAPNLVVSDLGIKAYKFYYPNGLVTTFSSDEPVKVIYTTRLGTSTYLSKGTAELTKGGVLQIKATNTVLGKARLSKAMKSSKAGKLIALFAIKATDANGNKVTLSRKYQIIR